MRVVALGTLVLAVGSAAGQTAEQRAIISTLPLVHPLAADAGMVVSQHRLASEVGRDVLADGGNAVDAAVATGFALAVVLPRAGNIGGGGFMMLHLAEEGRTLAIDYREMAPARAHRDMYLGEDGEVDNDLSRYSLQSAGVPGTVAGLHHVWQKHGSMPWDRLLAPAIRLAEQGFAVSQDMHNALARTRGMKRDPAARAVFYLPGSEPPQPLPVGTQLVQPDLAATLRRIAAEGPDDFYRGETARALVAAMEAGGGLISMEDLANYRVVERQPIRGSYRGMEVVTMPPPSSGGIHLVQMLNVLEGYDLKALGKGSAQSLHLLVETMKPAYADRSIHLGDSDFYPVPVDWLTSKEYAAEIRRQLNPALARPSDEILPGTPLAAESEDTTHFSIVDSAGNAVANTYTLNFSYGSGIMVPGTGMLLNNEMDDFSARAGAFNAYGLLGDEANSIQPGKRPLSSMTPTLLFENGQLRLVTGSPGGSRIITAVLQHIVDLIDFGLNIAESMHTPRIHHQWQPPRLFHERGLSPDTLQKLTDKGHSLQLSWPSCSLQSIAVAEDGTLFGASDPRRPDAAPAAHSKGDPAPAAAIPPPTPIEPRAPAFPVAETLIAALVLAMAPVLYRRRRRASAPK